MGFQIEDGKGKGKKASVTNKNALNISGVVRLEDKEAGLAGDSYLVSTGYVNHTVATAVGLFYVENNEDVPLVLERFNFNLQDSTAGTTTYGRFIFYRNPTGLTNSSTGTNIANLNFGSSESLDVNLLIGNGSTSAVSGGIAFASPLISIGEVFFIEGNIVIPKGSSFAMAYVPPAGNTFQAVGVGINLYKRSLD